MLPHAVPPLKSASEKWLMFDAPWSWQPAKWHCCPHLCLLPQDLPRHRYLTGLPPVGAEWRGVACVSPTLTFDLVLRKCFGLWILTTAHHSSAVWTHTSSLKSLSLLPSLGNDDPYLTPMPKGEINVKAPAKCLFYSKYLININWIWTFSVVCKECASFIVMVKNHLIYSICQWRGFATINFNGP